MSRSWIRIRFAAESLPALIHLRNDHPALQMGDFWMVDTGTRDVYSFIRSDGNETLLIVVNLTDEEVSDYALTLDQGPLSGTVEATVLFVTVTSHRQRSMRQADLTIICRCPACPAEHADHSTRG